LRLESGVADSDSVALATAYQLMESLKDPDINIDLNLVMAELLVEGIDKFTRIDSRINSVNSLENKVKLLSPV
jgi:transaldolase